MSNSHIHNNMSKSLNNNTEVKEKQRDIEGGKSVPSNVPWGKVIAMVLAVSILVAACTVTWVFQNWQTSLQVFAILVIIYVIGFYWRWLWIAIQTAPRDMSALWCYIKILRLTGNFTKKNWSMPDIFHDVVKKHPNKPCFLFEDESWTFQQVEDFSLRVSAVLRSIGVKKNDTVAVMASNYPEMPSIWLGIARIGGISPLINTNQTGNTLLHSINIAKCDALIYGSEFETVINEIKKDISGSVRLLKFTRRPLNTSSESVKVAESADDFTHMLETTAPAPWSPSDGEGFNGRLLYIYTSGTTGLPKAAVISSSRMVFMSSGVQYLGSLRPSDVIYCPMPLYHSAGGVITVGMAFIFGCTIALRTKFSASAYFPDCIKYNATVTYGDDDVRVKEWNQSSVFTVMHRFINRLNENIITHKWIRGWFRFTNQPGRWRCSRYMGYLSILQLNGCIDLYLKDNVCQAAHYIGEMCRYVLATPPSPTDRQHKVRTVYGNGMRPTIWTEFVKRFGIKKVVEFYGATEGNANIVNINNKTGAIGFVSRIIPAVYPIAIIKVDEETGEPIRDARGLCQLAKPHEPGVFIGKIKPDNPSRAFLGYVDKDASEKKIVRDVLSHGDSAFISGDILVADELGYLFFRDRTGDTFRWRGENVSTTEVEATISRVANQRDAVVYGVEIPNTEGRAGMCGIVDADDTLDLDKLAKDMEKDLPKYSRPVFIRVMKAMDMTATFKLRKVDLQKEGYNPASTKDQLFYFDSKQNKYVRLGAEEYNKIMSGQIRL